MNRATLQTLFEERLDYINDELFVCTALLFKVHSTRQSLIISDKISELILIRTFFSACNVSKTTLSISVVFHAHIC